MGWSGASVMRCRSKTFHMHQPRTRDPSTGEPSARVTYDSFFSSVTENLARTETIVLVEDAPTSADPSRHDGV
jgi:hypothetical protein